MSQTAGKRQRGLMGNEQSSTERCVAAVASASGTTSLWQQSEYDSAGDRRPKPDAASD
jgi:hypothetical protein